MNRLFSFIVSIICLYIASLASSLMDSARGDIVVLFIVLFLAFGLTGISLLLGSLTGNYDISGIIDSSNKTDTPFHKPVKKEIRTRDEKKMFQVDYFINNKRYGVPAREIVSGANVAEVRAKYLSDPKVRRVLQVKPLQ